MTYRAGVIGTGGIAGMGILGMHDEEAIGKEKIDASHAGGYASTDEIELVAVADVDEENLATFGEAWDIPTERQYLGHESMLAEEDLDVVSICTPSFLHHEHAIDAARSAAAPDVIWCEKPIASQVSAAEEMVAACEETDTELVVNHSFRFTDKLQRLHNLIHEENLLGEVKSVSTQYRMELMRNSTHVLDTLVYLLDARAERVSGYITGENEALDALDVDEEVVDAGGGGHIVMDDGSFVTVDCTIPRDISSMTFNFIGTEGKLYMNNDDGEWRYWALEDGEHVERPLPGVDGAWTWEDDYKRSFANAARHVEDLLNGEAENYSPGVDAARSLEIIVGFYLSHYTSSTIDVPLAKPLREISITSW
ncbi:Gfo/Idh/MocA family protein [Halopelagius longus]|uniref:Gfo/Idh/MocA family oxidoreductase n=1 Tax=Halopelagius longus TaxID=1236180 RepID=A0A1H1G3R3_9EURY|nr:Gfo/Idh/MocA family oxidoreductase [Halopelagius longus]RDI69877.1 gfo/Idh/MocA family oxidoreductase [Halopelagius longus]SDR07558.1 Predicted dehydrogenase [Halopelagius longus]